MILDSRYKNYWLDLSRKEKEGQETERKKSIAAVLAMLGQLAMKKRVPWPKKVTKNKP